MSVDAFWVIFDTSTKPDYYLDVHKLLALPEGAILRYNYRLELLSSSALETVSGARAQPTRTLLVYGQWKRFTRGDPTPPADVPFEEMFWVATRLAEMYLFPPLMEAERTST